MRKVFEHSLLFKKTLFFRTSPVPFNLEGAPPLSCILPPQEEENRSACRSYIMVSADHQRSGFFCALRRKFNVKGLRSKGTSTFLPLTSDIILQTSDIRHRLKAEGEMYLYVNNVNILLFCSSAWRGTGRWLGVVPLQQKSDQNWFKVQGSRIKVRATRGSMTRRQSRGSRFSDQGQSDQRSMTKFKVQGC